MKRKITAIIVLVVMTATIFAACVTGAYKVSFNVGTGVTNAPKAQVVLKGEMATVPADEPVKSGVTFAGWYANKACTVEFDFSKPITKHTTIYAGWDIGSGPLGASYSTNRMGNTDIGGVTGDVDNRGRNGAMMIGETGDNANLTNNGVNNYAGRAGYGNRRYARGATGARGTRNAANLGRGGYVGYKQAYGGNAAVERAARSTGRYGAGYGRTTNQNGGLATRYGTSLSNGGNATVNSGADVNSTSRIGSANNRIGTYNSRRVYNNNNTGSGNVASMNTTANNNVSTMTAANGGVQNDTVNTAGVNERIGTAQNYALNNVGSSRYGAGRYNNTGYNRTANQNIGSRYGQRYNTSQNSANRSATDASNNTGVNVNSPDNISNNMLATAQTNNAAGNNAGYATNNNVNNNNATSERAAGNVADSSNNSQYNLGNAANSGVSPTVGAGAVGAMVPNTNIQTISGMTNMPAVTTTPQNSIATTHTGARRYVSKYDSRQNTVSQNNLNQSNADTTGYAAGSSYNNLGAGNAAVQPARSISNANNLNSAAASHQAQVANRNNVGYAPAVPATINENTSGANHNYNHMGYMMRGGTMQDNRNYNTGRNLAGNMETGATESTGLSNANANNDNLNANITDANTSGASRQYYVNYVNGANSLRETVAAGCAACYTPSPSSADGRTFGGWYSDINHTVPFDKSAPVNADMNVYAKWL